MVSDATLEGELEWYAFPVSRGVRQGGVISPILFALYIDDLLYELQQSGVGHVLTVNCWIMLTFLDALVISVSKQMISCLGLGFVILLYRLDCFLVIVCLSMVVLCGLLIVVKYT